MNNLNVRGCALEKKKKETKTNCTNYKIVPIHPHPLVVQLNQFNPYPPKFALLAFFVFALPTRTRTPTIKSKEFGQKKQGRRLSDLVDLRIKAPSSTTQPPKKYTAPRPVTIISASLNNQLSGFTKQHSCEFCDGMWLLLRG